jgi:hypothetical protein
MRYHEKRYHQWLHYVGTKSTIPLYAGAKKQMPIPNFGPDHYLCCCQHSPEPRTKPALGLFCALEHLLVELVNGRVDLSACAVQLALSLCLCLLVLLPGFDAVLVELLLRLLCLSPCLVGLAMLAMRFSSYTLHRHTYC